MASVSSSPDPLPHGATGTVVYDSNADRPWAEVGLILDSGDYTSVNFLNLAEGDTFHFGPTATWDGTSGGRIKLRLFEFRKNGTQHDLADGEGTYL